MSSFKSNEDIHKKEDVPYYVTIPICFASDIHTCTPFFFFFFFFFSKNFQTYYCRTFSQEGSQHLIRLYLHPDLHKHQYFPAYLPWHKTFKSLNKWGLFPLKHPIDFNFIAKWYQMASPAFFVFKLFPDPSTQ